MLDDQRLAEVATAALVPYVGVAAEFVVQDAMDLLHARKLDAELADDARLRIFFLGLRSVVDASVPFDRVRDLILKKAR